MLLLFARYGDPTIAPGVEQRCSMAQKLEGDARRDALSKLSGWRDLAERDAISKRFEFRDFKGAFGLMANPALVAEGLGPHPPWVNVANKVDVTLSTHDAGGLTDLDIALAETMDRLAAMARERDS